MLAMPPTKLSPRRKRIITRVSRTRVPEPVVEAEGLSESPAPVKPNLFQRIKTALFNHSYLYGLLMVVVFAAGLLSGYGIWGYKPAPKPVIYKIDTQGFPSLGPADAPIVIVEFSDYQCPYCWRWYSQVYKSLLDAYPGKIRFVYRNFPLSFHKNAMASAEAALCAGDQKAYWEYHNKLFDSYLTLYQENQDRILDQATYNQFASDLGLNVVTFERCMSSHKYQQAILDDVNYANGLPPDTLAGEPAVGGTPTFFINGHRLGGAYPLEDFKKIIDAELAKLD